MADGNAIRDRINSEIGEWLKGVRQTKGLTLKDAASRSALGARTIAKFEGGCPIPLSALRKLVACYRPRPEFLIRKIREIQNLARTIPSEVE